MLTLEAKVKKKLKEETEKQKEVDGLLPKKFSRKCHNT